MTTAGAGVAIGAGTILGIGMPDGAGVIMAGTTHGDGTAGAGILVGAGVATTVGTTGAMPVGAGVASMVATGVGTIDIEVIPTTIIDEGTIITTT